MKNLEWSRRARAALRIGIVLFVLPLSTVVLSAQNGGVWKAPASADQLRNPLKGNEKATLAGKKLYAQYCAICHGNKGKGDGAAGMALKPRPANLTSPVVQKQTDGAIYWKITYGNPPMAAYKETLTEEQRWQLVNFIRTLAR